MLVPASLLLAGFLATQSAPPALPPAGSSTDAGPAATQPSTRPAHDRDPWVFRCVLDNNPRMLVISLGDHWWLAFNTVDCSIYKIWNGEIELTGAVYDTKHGPQPKAKGRFLLDGITPIQTPVQHITGERLIVETHWLGYVLQRDSVHLRWRKANLKFELQPKLTPTAIELTYTATRVVEDEEVIPDMAVVVLPDELKSNFDGPSRIGLKSGQPTVIRIKLDATPATSTTSENQ